MDKRGWIEIIEAFFAILLVAGVLLVLLNKGYFKDDLSDEIYDIQVSILREIQTNDTLREDIVLAVSGIPGQDLPIAWESPNFPQNVKDKVYERTPSSLNCTAKICEINDSCVLGISSGKDIYTQSVGITSSLQQLTFRKLNLFCWTKA